MLKILDINETESTNLVTMLCAREHGNLREKLYVFVLNKKACCSVLLIDLLLLVYCPTICKLVNCDSQMNHTGLL